jgi:hypothetical protein
VARTKSIRKSQSANFFAKNTSKSIAAALSKGKINNSTLHPMLDFQSILFHLDDENLFCSNQHITVTDSYIDFSPEANGPKLKQPSAKIARLDDTIAKCMLSFIVNSVSRPLNS